MCPNGKTMQVNISLITNLYKTKGRTHTLIQEISWILLKKIIVDGLHPKGHLLVQRRHNYIRKWFLRSDF